MSKIKRIVPVPHLDSQSGFTIKVLVELDSGAKGWGAVPRGASGKKLKELGFAVLEEEAVLEQDLAQQINPGASLARHWSENFSKHIGPKLVGIDGGDQRAVDAVLSDYNAKHYWKDYGINVMLAASIAVARASAVERGVELFERLNQLSGSWPIRSIPVPMTTILEGGARIANDLDVQAIMLVPIGALSVGEAHAMTDTVFFKIRKVMGAHVPPLSTSVGEQGGYVPRFGPLRDRAAGGWRRVITAALDVVRQAIDASGFSLGSDFCLAMDCAMGAQSFDKNASQYRLRKYATKAQGGGAAEDEPTVTTDELITFYEEIRSSHFVVSIEDPLHPDDHGGWKRLTARLGRRMQLVGDDFFHDKTGDLSPRNLLRRGADEGTANAALIMPNRAGTLTATLELVELARALGLGTVMSVRARETEDDSIADIAAAWSVPSLRCGGLQCSERNSKLERLKRIEELISPAATFGSACLLEYLRGC